MAETLRVALTLEQCWHRVPGGTAVAALETARRLEARDDVEVVGVAARHREPAPEPWTPHVPVAHLPLPRLALYETWHRLRRPHVETATGRVDVIHATGVAMPPRSAPVVVSIHDVAWLRDPAHFTGHGRRFFDRGLELARRDATLVLCSSHATLADLLALGFEPERLRHVPLGVDLPEASDEDVERVRRVHGLTRPYVAWIGTREPRKNLGGLIAAFKLLPAGLDLVLIGPHGWHEDLDALIGEDLGGRVRVLGFVPATDKGALLKGAEVFSFPSLGEGFGFPVLEAMTQGTPVVTSLATATEEIGRDASVLVEPRDPRSIAEGMNAVLADAALASKLAAAGRARAAEYTWDRTASLVVAAYREAAA